MHEKWLHGALPAILIHANIGSVYCWSLVKGPIAKSLEIATSDIELAFSLAIFFLGMSAAFCGQLVERNIKLATRMSAIFYSVGLCIASLGISFGSSGLVIAGYGAVMGIGLGLGYLSPIKTLMLWFKEHPGLATGLAIGGFGLGKVIYSPILELLFNNMSPENVLLVMAGIGLILIGGVAAPLLKKPEGEGSAGVAFGYFETLKAVMWNGNFRKIWLVFFLNITCGLAIISFESYIGTLGGLGDIAFLLALTAVFNTLGRVMFSSISDHVRNKAFVFFLFLSLSAVVSLLGGFMTGAWLLAMCIINAGYGGGFSSLPLLIKEKFGMEKLSTIHGLALSAWAWAGLIGNNMASWILGVYGVERLFFVLGALYVGALVLICNINKENAKFIKHS